MRDPLAADPESVRFGATIYVVLLAAVVVVLDLGDFSAVEAVQEATRYLCHHRPVRDGLCHAIDSSLNTDFNLRSMHMKKHAVLEGMTWKPIKQTNSSSDG